MNPQIILNVIAAVAAFGFLAALWVSVLMFISLRRDHRSRAIEERLGTVEGKAGPGRVLRLWHEGHLATTVVPSITSPSSWFLRMQQRHRAAGFEASFNAVFAGVWGVMLLVGVGFFAFTGKIILAVGAAVIVYVVFTMYVKRRVRVRDAIFENQFIDAMGLASRSLRAGHPLLGAFQLISEELTDPVRSLFASICQQHAMGLKLEEAIQRVADLNTNRDVQLFATAVTIQIRSGGNLAEVMERLADVIRDRVRIGRRVKVLTAQTQFSKAVLVGLPLVLFLVLELLNPEYMQPLLETTLGRIMLIGAGVNVLIGMFVMNRLTVLKY